MSYPILYSATETNFDHNGIGILGDCVSCEVTEEANGIFELAMAYPMDGIHFEDIADRGIIKAKADQFRNPQLFRIYAINKPMSGIVTVLAEHISYDLSGIPAKPFYADNVSEALVGLKNNAVVNCPFDFWTDKTTSGTFSVPTPASIRSKLGGVSGSILDVYGGEYEFDNYTVKLHNNRGMNRGVSIRYGKNLTDIRQEQNFASIATGVYPYWAGEVDGNTVVVELPEKIVNAPGTYNFVKIRTLDLSLEFETRPTVEQLRERTENYVNSNNIGIPKVSLTVSFAQLEQYEEYKHLKLLERVSLFDTVNVEFHALGVSTTAKAVKMVYDVLADRVKSVTLGSVRTNIADTIATQAQATKDILRVVRAPQTSPVSDTDWITNGRGYMVAVRDDAGNWIELCSLDEPDINTAKNVWRWNNGGFGFSSNGYQGPFETAITQDGHIVAKFISTGKISSADGRAYFDLDGAEVGVSAPYLDDGSISKFVLRNGQLFGTVTDKDGNVESHFEILMGDGGAHINNGLGSTPLYVYAFNALLQLGRMDSPCVLRGKPLQIEGDTLTLAGTEIHIKGAPIYLGDKELKWQLDPTTGVSYLVGVEVTT